MLKVDPDTYRRSPAIFDMVQPDTFKKDLFTILIL